MAPATTIDVGLVSLQVVIGTIAMVMLANGGYKDAYYLVVNALLTIVTYVLMRQLEAVQIRNLSPLDFELIPTLLMTVCVPLVAFIVRARLDMGRSLTLKESLRGFVMTAFELTISFAMYRLMPRALNPGPAMGLINALTLFVYSSAVQENYVFLDPELHGQYYYVPFSIILGTAITATVLSVKEPSETPTIRNVKLGIAGVATFIIVINNALGTTTVQDEDDQIQDQNLGEWLPITTVVLAGVASLWMANRSSQRFRDMQFRTGKGGGVSN